MFCSSCGKNNSEDSKYCINCGKKLIINQKTSSESTTTSSTKEKEIKSQINIEKSSYLNRLFQGRINRRNYIIGIILLYLLVFITAYCIGYIYGFLTGSEMSTELYETLNLVIGIVMLIYSLSLSTRRAHDIGKNGTYILWGIIPFVGLVIILQFLFSKGESQENQFGSQPKPKINIKNLFGF